MRAPLDSPDSEECVMAAAAFALRGPVRGVERLGNGLINTTWRVRVAGAPDVVLQCINAAAFPAPWQLMENFCRVTAHLAARGAATLRPVPRHDGAAWSSDAAGRAWRCLELVANSRAWDDAPDTAVARRAAAAFGSFAAALGDLPAPRLHEVIPGFHDTPARLAALRAAWAADPCGRAAAATPEVEAILGRSALGELLDRAARAGELRERVVHNDTKLNNVLFDRDSGRVACVIDLDTVMPGLLAHDFGDLVRSVAAVREPAGPRLDPDRYAAVAAGYLAGAGDLVDAAERHYFALAPAVITLELAARFLTDHLQGDRYFRVSDAGHNLRRCRDQLTLLRSIEDQAATLRRPLRRAVRRQRGFVPRPPG